MSFATKNDHIAGRKPIPVAADASCCAVRFAQAVAAGEMTLNALDNVGILPAGCVPIGLIVDSDDLDSNGTPTIQWAIGISNAAVGANGTQGVAPTDISSAAADGGAAWATGITTSQAGGQGQFYSKAMSRVTPVGYDRYIVAKSTTAAATGAAGELGVTLLFRNAG